MELTLKQIANPEDLHCDDPIEQARLRAELLQEQKDVNTVLPLVSNHHLLLVTLLLLNAIANEVFQACSIPYMHDSRTYREDPWIISLLCAVVLVLRRCPSS